MGAKLRFAVLGVGRRGLAHLKILKQLENVSVEAVYDPDEERVKECNLTYAVRGFTELGEMLDKTRLDAVVIASPTPFHVPQAEECLKRGLDVLMEKPISLSLEESKRLLKLVETSDRMVAVGFQTRYSNLAERLVENVDVETLSMITGFLYWTTPLVGWIRRRSLAGGQIVDQAIHLLDLFRLVAGEVETVHAFYTKRGRETEEDREAGFENWSSYAVALRFRNGVVGCLSTTYALYPGIFKPGEGYQAGFDVVCREKLIRYVHCSEVRVYAKGKPVEVYRLEGDPTRRMLEAFVEAVSTRDKKVLKTPYEDSYRSNLLALAANKSAEEGRPVNVSTLMDQDET